MGDHNHNTPSWVLIIVALIGAIGVVLAAFLSRPQKDSVSTPLANALTSVSPSTALAVAPQMCIVPQVEQLDQVAAEMAIAQLGLQTVKTTQYNAEVASALVISQEPPAGRRLNPCKGEVVIVISLGPVPTPIPPPTMPTPTPQSTPRLTQSVQTVSTTQSVNNPQTIQLNKSVSEDQYIETNFIKQNSSFWIYKTGLQEFSNFVSDMRNVIRGKSYTDDENLSDIQIPGVFFNEHAASLPYVNPEGTPVPDLAISDKGTLENIEKYESSSGTRVIGIRPIDYLVGWFVLYFKSTTDKDILVGQFVFPYFDYKDRASASMRLNQNIDDVVRILLKK